MDSLNFLYSAQRNQHGRNLAERSKYKETYKTIVSILDKVRERKKYDAKFSKRSELTRNEKREFYKINRLPKIGRIEALDNELKKIKERKRLILCVFNAYSKSEISIENVRLYFSNSAYRKNKSTASIEDLFNLTGYKEYKIKIVFCIFDTIEELNVFKKLKDAPVNSLIFGFHRDDELLIFAIAAEISKWNSLYDLINAEITANILINKIVNFIKILSDFKIKIYDKCIDYYYHLNLRKNKNSRNKNFIWWPRASLAINFDVDTEKILNGLSEQKLDELNRLAQAASDPETASQALYWYISLPTEIAQMYPDFLNHALFTKYVYGDANVTLLHKDKFVQTHIPSLECTRDIYNQFIEIPASTAPIGDEQMGIRSEPPATPAIKHQSISNFKILKFPFTNKMLQKIGFAEPGSDNESDELPLTNISVADCFEIGQRLQSLFLKYGLIKQNQKVTLPTEIQWEYAARGNDSRNYPWGDVYLPNHCNSISSQIGKPTQVGQFSPQGDSPFGIVDMSGNVREWTCSYGGNSIRDQTLYPDCVDEVVTQDTVIDSDQIIVRGGSYSYDDDCVMCWVRNKDVARQRRPDTGFRLVIAG